MAWLLYWLGEVQWLSLLSLFVAALVIVAVYLVQYGLSTVGRRAEKPPPAPPSELLQGDEDSLFAWLLSLNSWRREWQKAWITALNWEAKLREVSGRRWPCIGYPNSEMAPAVASWGALSLSLSVFLHHLRVAILARQGFVIRNVSHLRL